MIKIVGVRFRNAGKAYYFDPKHYELHTGDHVIVETARGVEYGTVVGGVRMVEDEKVIQPLRAVIREATAEDNAKAEHNRVREREAVHICNEKISKHHLDMKLIDAEYTFDNSKLLFYFTADGRIDFRELVKDLAAVFRMRIELRQVGVRDETKVLGGVGICGRVLCCHSYLSDFVPVSIRMAKEQNLSLNPAKISGVCGRLMCCLKNEQETYEYLNSRLPAINDTVLTADGQKGIVQSVNVLRQRIKVLFEENGEKEVQEFEAAELTFRPRRRKGGKGGSKENPDTDEEMTASGVMAEKETAKGDQNGVGTDDHRGEKEDMRQENRRSGRGESRADDRRENRKGRDRRESQKGGSPAPEGKDESNGEERAEESRRSGRGESRSDDRRENRKGRDRRENQRDVSPAPEGKDDSNGEERAEESRRSGRGESRADDRRENRKGRDRRENQREVSPAPDERDGLNGGERAEESRKGRRNRGRAEFRGEAADRGRDGREEFAEDGRKGWMAAGGRDTQNERVGGFRRNSSARNGEQSRRERETNEDGSIAEKLTENAGNEGRSREKRDRRRGGDRRGSGKYDRGSRQRQDGKAAGNEAVSEPAASGQENSRQ